MRQTLSEISRVEEKEMLARGILSRENGRLKINESALHALTVLAKSFGKKLPVSGLSGAGME
jgi:hypothetical protein